MNPRSKRVRVRNFPAFRLVEATKPHMRAASMRLASRVLRAADRAAAADAVDRLAPEAVCSSRRAQREVSFRVLDADVFARSSRRAGLRYVARRLRVAGGYDDDADYLDRVASFEAVGSSGPAEESAGRVA